MSQFGRIGVLMGGASSEREISLKSGRAVYDSLKSLNLDVTAIDIKNHDREENSRLLKTANINCAFIAMHGFFGEDGQMQQILEDLKIPYTGSGVKASRLAMDKILSRKVFEKQGLAVPRSAVLEKSSSDLSERKNPGFNFPLVVKPAANGSSVGLSIIDQEADLEKAIDLAFSFDERILIEEFISGRELTAGILEEKPLPVIEIVPKKRFFDFEAKYQSGMADYIIPAQLLDGIIKMVQDAALSAHKAIGCFGCSRVDIILNKEDIPFILEVNSIPGFTATSLLPKAARVAGLEFAQLCLKLIELAFKR